MKRFLLLLLVVTLPASAFAAETHRYLVATRHAVHGPMTLDPADTPRGENVESFQSVDGYAADLTDEEVAALRQSPGVRYVEPVKPRHALDIASNDVRNINGQTTPYGISLVNANTTWPFVTGNGINVVVIDTGIDYHHPELAPIFAGGRNTFNNTDDPMDDNGHGTHCAGTIAAANNDSGVVGVAPNVKLWSVKVLDKTGSGSTDKVVKALDWVTAKKAALGGDWIVSLSLGSTDGSTFEEEAFARAASNGILAVAASGNESEVGQPAPVDYPAAYSTVFAVGAVDSAKSVASFSNQGPELAVVAPGVNVLSTLPVGSGTIAYVTNGSSTISASTITGSKLARLSGTYVNCNLGRVQDFTSAVRGNIALIKRGDITFNEKVKNAVNAGASAVVIYNKDSSAISWTLIGQTCDASGGNCVDSAADLAYNWPVVVGISQTDGDALAAIATPPAITVANLTDDYGTKSGTSMATPHVAGVAALVWSAAPNADANAVRTAILETAHDLGAAGRDNVYGAGLVDAHDAVLRIAPNITSGATPPPQLPVPGRRILKRSGH